MKKILFITIFILSTVAMAQDRSIIPQAAPAPEIQIGSTESFEMENGLKVFVVENHKLPVVSFSLQFKYHPELETDLAGLSSITADLMGTNTTNRSKDEIDAAVDYIGATLESYSKGVYASSLSKYMSSLMDVFSDVVINSKFTQEEFDKLIKQTKSGLASALDDPDQIASNVTSVMNFGKGHIYGELMTEETLSNISLEDCNTFYNTYFSPKGSYMAIVGDITVDDAKKIMNKYMSSWKSIDYKNTHYKGKNPPNQNEIALVHKSGAVQSVINITYPIDIHPASKDALKVKVLNNILGGGSTGRLFLNLREDKAYTYGAYSMMSVDEIGSSFKASAKVRNEVTDSAIVEFLSEISTLRQTKVSEQELQGVKTNMAGKFAISLENASTVARFAINMDHLGLNKDHYSMYLKRLDAITVNDIYEVAQKYLKPNNAHIVVVGDSEQLEEKLAVFGPVTLYDHYGVEKSDIAPVPAGITAESIIADYIDVLGGEKKLKKLNSLESHYSVDVPGAPAKMEMEILQKQPNLFSISMNMMGMLVQRQYFNGTNGFIDGMQGNMDLKDIELEEAINEYKLGKELSYFDENNVVLLGLDELNGEQVYVISKTGVNDFKVTEYYSVSSKYLVKSERSMETPKGEMLQSSLYKDYKMVSGYYFPHTIAQSAAGQIIDMKLEKVLVNKKIDQEKFE